MALNSVLPYDVLLLGDYFYDLIYTGLPEFPSLGRETFASSITSTGGAMYITAAAMRRLGARVGWPAQFGTDEYSRFVRELCHSEDLDLSIARVFDHPFRRITTSMPYAGERAFVTYEDPEPADQLQFWLHQVETVQYRHLHIGGLMPLPQLLPLLEAARRRGVTVSMDCQDSPQLTSPCDWRELLALVDIFMPNAREVRIITGHDHINDALRTLAEWVPVAVVKDGAHGACMATHDGVWHAPSIAVGEVVDTTGAGDCFNAGFLYGHLVEHASPLTCLQYGNICGGLSVTGVGGATHAPTRKGLTEAMNRFYP